ncbi:MAG: hypothetical protein DWQ44_11495 [Bacteroidetes bacterium]|nr:MAG: hypothetical protein DWQ33_09615 [Bacteroidota bacterium]REK05245.1 MAG: hypothetical protein DWQ39_08625 [Bacteroidota bacterium]REK32650.1 MAG: hypothetical protein DWQ44_11495 [Bacteroidota bacterium]REK48903.1 MAG: hypothetical protein DWQ48_08465 [Bacteroidota bacterium]
MDKLNTMVDEFISHVKEYLEARTELSKLKAINHGSSLAARVMAVLIIGFLLFLFVIFLSMVMAMAISQWLNSPLAGYSLVTLFYLLCAVLIFMMRRTWVIKPLRNYLIRILCNKPDDYD